MVGLLWRECRLDLCLAIVLIRRSRYGLRNRHCLRISPFYNSTFYNSTLLKNSRTRKEKSSIEYSWFIFEESLRGLG